MRQRPLPFIPVFHAIIITHLNVRLCTDFYFFLDRPSLSSLVLCLALSLWCVWPCLLCALSPCLCVLWPALCVALCLALTCVPRPYTPLYMGCL